MFALRAVLSPVVIAAMTIVGSVMALVIRLFDPSGDRVVDLAQRWSRLVTRLSGVRVVVDRRAELDPGRSYVFMANHLSALDIWTMFIAIPLRVRMIAKKQLASIPLFGWAMAAGRFIFIDRANPVAARRSIDEAKARIRGGQSVLLFPEGTRSRDGSLGPFKKGGFHLAIDSGAPIVPVAIHGTRELMPRGSVALRAGVVKVTLGAPIATDGLSAENRDALLGRVRGEIEKMLAESA